MGNVNCWDCKFTTFDMEGTFCGHPLSFKDSCFGYSENVMRAKDGDCGPEGKLFISKVNKMNEQMQINPVLGIPYDEFVGMLAKKMPDAAQDLMHGVVGIAGEAGELLDAAKKHWIYNKDLDTENVLEELGDIRFYMQMLMNQFNWTMQDLENHNRLKLSKRYEKLQYSDAAAQARADKA